MQKILLSIFILLSAITAIAQSNKMVDSLLKKLDKEKVDSNRMKLYQKIGTYYIDNNAGKAIDYLENSLEIAKKLDKSLFIANNYYSIGFCYLVKSNFNKSLENYQLSIQLYEKLKDSLRLSNAYMSVGSLYSQTKDFAKTNEYYDKATKIIEAKKDSTTGKYLQPAGHIVRSAAAVRIGSCIFKKRTGFGKTNEARLYDYQLLEQYWPYLQAFKKQ
jgi:tetratricopeptide (TPR) repeat protein